MNLNFYDILILIAFSGVVFAIIRKMVNSRKRGNSCGGCKGCPSYKQRK